MRSHLSLLGILQLTWGGVGLLLGAALLLLSVGALAIGLMNTGDRVAAGVTAFDATSAASARKALLPPWTKRTATLGLAPRPKRCPARLHM